MTFDEFWSSLIPRNPDLAPGEPGDTTGDDATVLRMSVTTFKDAMRRAFDTGFGEGTSPVELQPPPRKRAIGGDPAESLFIREFGESMSQARAT